VPSVPGPHPIAFAEYRPAGTASRHSPSGDLHADLNVTGPALDSAGPIHVGGHADLRRTDPQRILARVAQ
jgi:hypothetical protein